MIHDGTIKNKISGYSKVANDLKIPDVRFKLFTSSFTIQDAHVSDLEIYLMVDYSKIV